MASIRLREWLDKAFPRDALLRLRRSPHWWITVSLIVAVSVMYYVCIEFFDTPIKLFYFEVRHDLHGIVYLLPFFYGALTLGVVGATASWIVVFVVALPRILYYSIGPYAELHNSLFLAAPFFIVLTVLLELRWREQHAQLAAERERERKLHIDHVFSAQEHERHRIAQGLHDDVLQRLMAIAVLSENCKGGQACSSDGSTEVGARIREESLRLADELRRLSYDLRPSMLDTLGLVPAVDWLSQRLQQETGIGVSFYTKGHATRLSAIVETKVFRLVQEGINNIRQHASATEATITLNFLPALLVVDVSDNGTGFAAARAMRQAAERGHLGLLGMRERVESMGGTLSVRSNPGRGTSIVARIPLEGSVSDCSSC